MTYEYERKRLIEEIDDLKQERVRLAELLEYREDGYLDRSRACIAELNRLRRACIIAMDCCYVGPGLCNVCRDLLHKALEGKP